LWTPRPSRGVGLVSLAFRALAAEAQLWRGLVLRSLALAADSVTELTTLSPLA
jgi:hypothetical protein